MMSCSGGSEWPGNLPRADWRDLADLNLSTGAVSPTLDTLLGPVVRIAGFIVPFEDSLSKVSTFLLVPNFGACVHLPPPAPNQMILVEMEEGVEVEFDLWTQGPIWAVGVLSVTDNDSPWGAVGFSMKAQASVKFADGLAEDEDW